MERAHNAVYGEPVSYAAPNRYAVSSDAGPMFEYGIKGLTYGPGGVSAGGSFTVYDASQQQSEVLSIQNLSQGCGSICACCIGSLRLRRKRLILPATISSA